MTAEKMINLDLSVAHLVSLQLIMMYGWDAVWISAFRG